MPITQDQANFYRKAGYWTDTTFHEYLDTNAESLPDICAVKDAPNRMSLTGEPATSLSWRELKHASQNLALALQQRGVERGDKVLVQMPNVTDLVVVYYALSRLGAVISPIPVQYDSHEIEWVSSVLKNRFAITSGSLNGAPLPLQRHNPTPVSLLVVGQDIHIDQHSSSEPVNFEAVDPGSIVTICWTSGTTGTPKGVPRHHNHWMAVGYCNILGCNYGQGDILLNPFPLVNMAALGGFLAPAVMTGATLILHHPIDVPVFLNQLVDEKVNFTIAPPPLLNQLAANPAMWKAFDFSSLRAIGSGAAPLSPWMIETFENEYGKTIVNFYGSNEGIALHSTPESAPEAERRAAYFRIPTEGSAIQVAVADPESYERLQEVGQVGELLMSGPTVFDGYYDHDNCEVFDSHGYFRTGDLVEISGDEGEYLRIVGRCKEMINRGGFKVSPVELDGLLETIPGVTQAAAFSVQDARLGERIGAAIVMESGHEPLSIEAIQAHFESAGVAKFKWPEKVVCLEDLPRNPLAKVQRFKLSEDYGASF
jgi:cyclohexanecarboxylate-CoA ligase